MKRLIPFLFALLLALPAAAQLPPGGIAVGYTPVQYGTNGNCLNITNGKVGQAACGGAPSGAAGGDLGGTYPNPTVVSVADVTTGVLVGANGGTGVANSGKTITLGGNLTTSGAFATTFTMTAATGVTFPTTGTLATVNGNIGVFSGTSLALGGATIGTDALGITGTATISGLITATAGVSTPLSYTAAAGAITANTPALAATQTWNAVGTTFKGISLNVVNTASAAGSRLLDLLNNSSSVFNIDASGNTTASGFLRSATNIQVSGTGFFGSTSKTLLATGVTDGVLGLSKNDGATGVSLDFSTTAVMKVRNYANSGDAAITAANITSSGQLNVTTMTQTSAAQSGTVCYNSGTGAVTYDATLGCLTSSERFKTDITDIQRPDALALTMALAPVSFRKKAEFGGAVDPSYHVGFIAEQVADVDERLVSRNEDGVRGVRYQEMGAIFAGAIQELNRKVMALEARR